MASSRIAGITIEIGGDTSKLQNSLKAVDKQLSVTQSNLKDIDKLLKFNPGNVELLTQKQKKSFLLIAKSLILSRNSLFALKLWMTNSLKRRWMQKLSP